jgi:colanic acid biosynthesis glycosyl transferase WcaI
MLFVCSVFYPDQQASSQLYSELLAQLRREGISWTVITTYPNDELLAASCAEEEIWRGVRIVRCGIRLNYKKSLAIRLLSYAVYAVGLCVAATSALQREGACVATTNPPFAPLLVATLCLILGRPYHIALSDIYPEGLVAVGRISRESLISRLWHYINGLSFTRAQTIIVLGRDMRELLLQYYGCDQEKVKVIANWSPSAPYANVQDAKMTKMALRLNIREKFIVQYAGNMGLWHDLNDLIEAAAILRNDKEIVFLMVGGGLRRQQAEEKAHRLALENVIWQDAQPTAELADLLSCSDVSIVSQREGTAGIAVPSKLYGIMAHGRPIVAQVPEDSEVGYVVSESKCGVVVRPGDSRGFASAIAFLKANPALAREMGMRARDEYERKYSFAIAARKYQESLGAEWTEDKVAI